MLISIAFAWASWDASQISTLLRQKYGINTARLFEEINQQLRNSQSLSELERLKRVNELVNRRIRFAEDSQIWGQPDYWASVGETLSKGAGDCEDYTIAKFFLLQEIGIAPERLRLTYVRARIGGPDSRISQAHMVLAYYATPSADPLVLDNLISDVRPASARPDLTPVFSFNLSGIFAGNQTRASAGVDRLSRWKDLLAKMKSEGFIN